MKKTTFSKVIDSPFKVKLNIVIIACFILGSTLVRAQLSEKLPPGSNLYVIELGNGTTPIQGWLFINY